jgi:hypothetical protein
MKLTKLTIGIRCEPFWLNAGKVDTFAGWAFVVARPWAAIAFSTTLDAHQTVPGKS